MKKSKDNMYTYEIKHDGNGKLSLFLNGKKTNEKLFGDKVQWEDFYIENPTPFRATISEDKKVITIIPELMEPLFIGLEEPIRDKKGKEITSKRLGKLLEIKMVKRKRPKK